MSKSSPKAEKTGDGGRHHPGDPILSRKGQGERVKALIVSGQEFDGRASIWVHPGRHRQSLWKDGKLVPAAQAIVDKGAGILAIDAFRIGDSAKDRPTTNMKVGSLAYAGYFYGYNRSLVAERVHDILTAVAWAKGHDKVKSIHLVGFDKAGPWVVLARGLCGDAVSAPRLMSMASASRGQGFR